MSIEKKTTTIYLISGGDEFHFQKKITKKGNQKGQRRILFLSAHSKSCRAVSSLVLFMALVAC